MAQRRSCTVCVRAFSFVLSLVFGGRATWLFMVCLLTLGVYTVVGPEGSHSAMKADP